MSFNYYSILGITTDLELEELKAKAISDIKAAKVGLVSDNNVHFPFDAVGFIDIFIDQKEIRAEVQAKDEEGRDKAQEIMKDLLQKTVGYTDEPSTPHVWRDVTQAVLSARAKDAQKQAKLDSKTTLDAEGKDPAK